MNLNSKKYSDQKCCFLLMLYKVQKHLILCNRYFVNPNKFWKLLTCVFISKWGNIIKVKSLEEIEWYKSEWYFSVELWEKLNLDGCQPTWLNEREIIGSKLQH